MIRNRMLAGASALSVFALTACSSGGGDPETPDSTPPNSAPQITGATVIRVDENTISVTTISASDADGDSLSYAITGGADGTAFEMNSNSGVLTFAESPDFEAPSDADADNVYFVTVTVTDGSGGSAEATYEIAVANVPDVRYLEQIFTQTTRSEDIVYASGSDTYVMNVITPQGDTETRRPLALLASGGAFAVTNRNQVEPFAEVFARAGYTAAIIDYRTLGREAENSTEFRFAAQDATHDMIGALRFLRANAQSYDINPDIAIVGGPSGGGFMGLNMGTLDPDDPLEPSLVEYLSTRGGVYGDVGDHLDQSPDVQGVLSISANVAGLNKIDANSAPVYAAHNELDPVAPCYTVRTPDGQFSYAGTCDFIPEYETLGIPHGSFIVLGDEEHVDFTNEEYQQIFAEALALFYNNVVTSNET